MTKDQQTERVAFKESNGSDSVRGYIRFWASVVAKDTKRYFDLGKGRFRLITDGDISETEMIDSAIEDGDTEVEEFEGKIYAFSFPSIVKEGVFPIKVGKTTGDVEARVQDQCKGSASFELNRPGTCRHSEALN